MCTRMTVWTYSSPHTHHHPHSCPTRRSSDLAPVPNPSVVPTAGADFRTFVSVARIGPDLETIDNPGEAFPALMLGSPFGIEDEKIGRASCRERVERWGVGGGVKKKE